MILQEFDENVKAIINPEDCSSKIDNFPKVAITCFSKTLIDRYAELFNAEEVGFIKNANGINKIYKISFKGNEYGLFMSYVGVSPCVAAYEELFVMGIEKIIVFGTCGVLDKGIKDLSIIIPTSAIRDEGTSYHYQKAGDEIKVNHQYQSEFESILKENNINYIKGKVWTTDGFYRETSDKMLKRKNSGCICVDMECSALSALAKFRNKDIFQFFYAADNLDSINWNKRSLGCGEKLQEKEKIVYLALALAEKINN